MLNEQYDFGIGGLFGVRSDIANPTPIRFGTCQEASAEFSRTDKPLMGQYAYPVAIAQGGAKITGKIKSAKINARQFNDAFFNQSLTTPASAVQVVDESGPGGTAIPSTPFQVVVANGGSMSSTLVGVDLGVFNAASGAQFKRVASSPTAGQYSWDGTTGTYLFASADNVSGIKVVFSYEYYQTATGSRITGYNQIIGGTQPTIVLHLGNQFGGNKRNLILYSALFNKLSMSWKNEDWEIPELDYSAGADSLGRVFDWSTDQ